MAPIWKEVSSILKTYKGRLFAEKPAPALTGVVTARVIQPSDRGKGAETGGSILFRGGTPIPLL